MLTVYGIKNCDTMKKAFAWLDERGVSYQFHDYKKAGVPADKLATWLDKKGWQVLSNTRGPTWRKIPVERTAGLDNARALALLQEFSSAIKRPVVEGDGLLLVGFAPDEWAARLGS